MENRANKSKVMGLAWELKKQATKDSFIKGTGIKSFSHYLSIAWKAVKKWNGKFNEVVSVLWTEIKEVRKQLDLTKNTEGWCLNPAEVVGTKKTEITTYVVFRR